MARFLKCDAELCLKSALLAAFAVCWFPSQLHAQQLIPVLRPGNAPKTVVYRHIFKHIEYLENRAAQVERSGADVKPLREYYKLSAGLNEAEQDRVSGSNSISQETPAGDTI